MTKSVSAAAMRQTPGRLPLLVRRAAALVSIQGRVGGESGSSGAYIGGECSRGGWVESGGVASLSRFFGKGTVHVS